MIPVPISLKVRGNEDLAPEKLRSIEFGYRGIFNPKFEGEVDVFFNKINGLIDFGAVETYAQDSLFPGLPGEVIPSLISGLNVGDSDVRGGEISMELLPIRWISANTNYSYQYVTNSKTGERIESAPRHKLNSGLYVELKRGFLISLYANYVDETVWEGEKIDPYILLNFVIKYKLNNLELTCSVSNLLNNRHLEHPAGKEIGRSVILGLVYQIR